MNLTEFLEPIASFVRSLNLPEVIIQWGHPIMMGIVVFVMGTVVGLTGWKGRLASDNHIAGQNRTSHRQLAPWMLTFIALGYTGGILSLVVQRQPILASPHFWTGSVVLTLLVMNGLISWRGFGENQQRWRTLHAYLGTMALQIMIIHAVVGLQLGLSL